MELRIADALREVSEVFGFSLTEAVAPIEYAARTLSFKEPFRIEGHYTFDGKAVNVSAHVSTVLDSVCARCAEPFAEPLSFDLNERFVRGAQEDDEDDCYPYEGERIALDKAVMDNLYLSLPLVSICREDCKGLCPVCGIDRNKGTCTCEQGVPDGPFAALSKIKFEDQKD